MRSETFAAKGQARRLKKPLGFGERPQDRLLPDASAGAPWAAVVGEALTAEAEQAGLLTGDKSQHVTFRAPPALVEAAKRNAGIASTSELGMLALVILASRDPVVDVMRATRGVLGKDHTLEC